MAVCKSDYEMAKPLLADLAHRDPLSFFQCLHWYARDKVSEWQGLIVQGASLIRDNEEAFRFFTYVLEPLPIDRGACLAPFTRSGLAAIRRQAFHAIGKIGDRARYLAEFFAGLDDADDEVVLYTLQSLEGLKHPSLLPHYQRLAARFPVERAYVLRNLELRLKEFGLSRAELKDAVFPVSH